MLLKKHKSFFFIKIKNKYKIIMWELLIYIIINIKKNSFDTIMKKFI